MILHFASKIEIRVLSWFIVGFTVLIPFVPQRAGGSSAITLNNRLLLPPVVYDSGGQLAWSLAVADVNADDKQDVVVVNYGASDNSSVGVLLGNGDGTFRPAVVYGSGGSFASGIAIGDLNGDGKADLVVAHQGCLGLGACVGVLLGNGDGSFQPAAIYSDGGRQAVSGEGIYIPTIIADLNGDGKPDLLVVSQTDRNYGDGVVGVLLGNGDGTFKPVVTYDSGGFGAFSGIVADVNGDSKPDVVVLNCTRGSTDCFANQATLGVLLGNGDGTFQPVRKFGTGGVGGFFPPLVVADVNIDGKPDILVGNYCPSNNCSQFHGSFTVLLGNGDGTFQPAVTYDAEESAVSIAVADLNGDGRLDLVVSGPPLDVWLSNGDGTFRRFASYPASGGTNPILLADLNSDGVVDLVGINGTSNSADVHLGNGDGTFQELQTFPLGGSAFSWATVADVNADGRPDLLSTNWFGGKNGEGAVGVLLNNTPFCATPPAITFSAAPMALWPPNGKMVPVTISGKIKETGNACTTKTASYAVKDEYGEVQPSGPVNFGANGAYSFMVWLQASRLGTDLDGRSYKVTVRASNNAGKTGSKAANVIVPHDQGH